MAKEVVTWLKGGFSGSSVNKVYGWKKVNPSAEKYREISF